MTVVYIALAGALGCVCRYALETLLTRATAPTGFPWATFAVNALGSFALGVAMALFAARGELDSRTRLAVTAGLLGGFTTYSAFAYETVALLERRHITTAATYVGLTLVAATACCALGITLTRLLLR